MTASRNLTSKESAKWQAFLWNRRRCSHVRGRLCASGTRSEGEACRCRPQWTQALDVSEEIKMIETMPAQRW